MTCRWGPVSTALILTGDKNEEKDEKKSMKKEGLARRGSTFPPCLSQVPNQHLFKHKEFYSLLCPSLISHTSKFIHTPCQFLLLSLFLPSLYLYGVRRLSWLSQSCWFSIKCFNAGGQEGSGADSNTLSIHHMPIDRMAPGPLAGTIWWIN